ncbi:YbaN family protein [Alloyangia mangrovi]|uniref:YbaN family protein n=1 Tax=Alloyangia mangrovi TaxID=1779329 RepID=UPI00288B9057|nr:YbaN family protein [Alloyangia mangrovi]
MFRLNLRYLIVRNPAFELQMSPERPEEPQPPPRSRLRIAWLALGGLALGAGVIGIVLPLLPTTPFVILAAFAFSKSSPRLHRFLVEHPRFGPMIADWTAHGAIAPRYKALAVSMMLAALTLSVWLAVPNRVLLIQLVCMGGAAAFVLSRPNGPR